MSIRRDRRVQQKDRHCGALRHVRFQRYARGQAPGRTIRLRRCGTDGDFLAREIKAGIFQQLDKSRLPNLVNAWPDIASRLAFYDPGNLYAANYMWGTTGIGYNVTSVKQVLGPDAAIDSWDDVFNPAKIARFKNCGVHLLDSSDDLMPAALHYLRLDPNSSNPAELEKAPSAADAGAGPRTQVSLPRNYRRCAERRGNLLAVGYWVT